MSALPKRAQLETGVDSSLQPIQCPFSVRRLFPRLPTRAVPPPPRRALCSQSGAVTKDEFCEYLRDSVGMGTTAATTSGAELFSHLDVNADHALSVMEFVFGLHQMPASLRRAMLDTVPPALPGDVARTGAEAVVPLAEASGVLDKLFTQMDNDGDGVLSIKELKVRRKPRLCVLRPGHSGAVRGSGAGPGVAPAQLLVRRVCAVHHACLCLSAHV